jgi:hypothetical protein
VFNAALGETFKAPGIYCAGQQTILYLPAWRRGELGVPRRQLPLLGLGLLMLTASTAAAQAPAERLTPGTYQGRVTCRGMYGSEPISISVIDARSGGQEAVLESGGEDTPLSRYRIRIDPLGPGQYRFQPTQWEVRPPGYENAPAIVESTGAGLRVTVQGPCTPFVVTNTKAIATRPPAPAAAPRGPVERTPQTTAAPFNIPTAWPAYDGLSEGILLARARDSMIWNNYRVARIYFEQAVGRYGSTQGMAGLAFTFSPEAQPSAGFHNLAAERYWCEKAYVKAMGEPLPIFDTVMNFCRAPALKNVVRPAHRAKIEASLARVKTKQQADYQGALRTAQSWLDFGWRSLDTGGGDEYNVCIKVSKNSVDAEDCKRRYNRP